MESDTGVEVGCHRQAFRLSQPLLLSWTVDHDCLAIQFPRAWVGVTGYSVIWNPQQRESLGYTNTRPILFQEDVMFQFWS